MPNEIDQTAIAERSHAVRAGETLYRAGDHFHAIHTVRCGTLKSCVTLLDGREQVCAFHLPGDVLGLDGVANGQHRSTATALQDSQTRAVAFAELQHRGCSAPSVQRDLHQLMAHEMLRGRQHLLLLGSMDAHERMGWFLLDLSRRHLVHGYSAREFHLHMTRAEIGSYLGLALETVSRALSEFKRQGFLEVANRNIRIIDLPAFRRRFASLN